MDWFRWHHGSVNDPKFQLVAKKAGASVAEVIAVWACMLEAASGAEDRGDPGTPDFEAMECALGLQDGLARRIYEQMRTRELVDPSTGRITRWEKRQPKREDETANERKRRQREREHELATVTTGESRDVTQGHADVTLCHAREEERREEEETSNLTVAPARPLAEAALLALVEPMKPQKPGVPSCPHLEILALWAEVLPAMPQHLPEQWKGARSDHLRARWRETAVAKNWGEAADGLAYFRRLFAYIGQSRFLTGRAKPKGDARPFVIELEWLVNPTNWAKVVEGKYHQEAA
jgi:hypothetical protein